MKHSFMATQRLPGILLDSKCSKGVYLVQPLNNELALLIGVGQLDYLATSLRNEPEWALKRWVCRWNELDFVQKNQDKLLRDGDSVLSLFSDLRPVPTWD